MTLAGHLLQIVHVLLVMVAFYAVGMRMIVIPVVWFGGFLTFYLRDGACPITTWANMLFAQSGAPTHANLIGWMTDFIGHKPAVLTSVVLMIGPALVGIWHKRKRTRT